MSTINIQVDFASGLHLSVEILIVDC